MRRVRRVREGRAARRRLLGVLAMLGVLVAASGCGRAEEPPIRRKGAWLVVENQSKIEWRDVSVTLNQYYTGVAPRVAPGGRLEAPLAGFVSGFGQRFNPARETLARVDVRATDASGKPVRFDWDEKMGQLAEEREGR